MKSEPNFRDVLLATVQLKHKCKAVHYESVPIEERLEGKLVWQGSVEVFKLTGHPKSAHCFAWANILDVNSHEFVTILQKRLAMSPQAAVKAWLANRPTEVSNIFLDTDTALNKHGQSSTDTLPPSVHL